MAPEEALEIISREAHLEFALNNEYAGGQDSGAFRVASPTGNKAVLKLNRNPVWVNQIQRAKAATTHLAALGYPVARYLFVGSTDRGTYSLQSALPGLPASPTVPVVQRLIELIELQKDQAISEVQGQDWVWYIMDVVFRGEWGNVRALMQFNAETSTLVSGVETLVRGLDNTALPKTDLVHGDMGIGQVLIEGGQVTGVVDWDQVGYGDRTQDLVSLWYSVLIVPECGDLVMQHMLKVSTKEAIKIHGAYKMLTNVSWIINKAGGDVSTAVVEANSALAQLQKLV
jgi:aminoglycoside phosphotransferase